MRQFKTNRLVKNRSKVRISAFDVQSLEKRTLMAADPATVVFSKGLLTVTGGTGDDQITVSRNGNNWTVTDGSWSKVITAVVTKLTVNGKAGNDKIVIDASVAVAATLIGEAGNDTLVGGNGATSLNGGAGDDSLVGGAGNDTLVGDIGNDYINGGAGNDKLSGGAGNDYLTAGDGNDSMTGDAGNDTLVGGNGNNTLNGGAGDDSITSGSGNDSLIGDVGNDTINGGDGADKIYGGAGNDLLNGQGGDDFIQGGLGYDTMSGGTGTDTIDYTDHTAKQGIWLNMNGDTNAGMSGEGDTVDGSFEIANGGAGNDYITGNDTGVTIYGNAGNDTLHGGAGDDQLFGGAGDDALLGHDGNDDLYGGVGNDHLDGGAGDDLLVAVGGGKASLLIGGDGNDTFWLDSDTTETVTDASSTETNEGAVHRVATFANKQSKDLTGQALADPTIKGKGIIYRNFKTDKLFSDAGPSLNDIQQGQLGDCYFLAQLGSYAKIDPEMIRQHIVDFGDGTYGVQFNKGSSTLFYRIDADLPSYNANTLAYANFGAQNSLWVALYEKAWTFARAAKNTYASIEAGFMTEVAGAFGKSSTWGNVTSVADAVLQQLQNELANGQSVTIGTGNEPSNSQLVGGHAYTVVSITDDGNGGHIVVLRNPWGVDGYTSADGVQDGYITLTSAQFGAWTSSYAVAAA